MEFINAAYCDRGLRPVNEDSLLFYELLVGKHNLVFMAVSDGIGSLDEGENASGYVIECLREYLFGTLISQIEVQSGLHNVVARIIKREVELFSRKATGSFEKDIKDAIYDISLRLSEYASLKGISLGATLSMCIIYKGRYTVVQLGDSAVFLFKGKKYKRISPLHTNSDGSINRCVGSMGYFEPDIIVGRIKRGMGMLLATDGYYKKTEDDLQALSAGNYSDELTLKRRLKQIGELGRKRGEGDNASAAFLKCI